MKFYKSMMMDRLKAEGRIHEIDAIAENIMNDLDQCDVTTSCWERAVNNRHVYWCVGKSGVGYLVAEVDCK